MKRLENKGLGILVLVLVTVLSGCSSLPTGGAVGTSMALGTPKRVHPMAGIDPPEPQENANPTDIIAGFVKAASGVENSFQVARKYLASDIANSWNGSESTTV